MPLPEGDLPDALILAALQRAELHGGRDEPGASYASLVAHLGRPMGSATGRKLRPRLRQVEATGLIEPAKRRGILIYTATPKGRRALKAAGAVALPESPQHRRWREGRAAAAERTDDFRDALDGLLAGGAAFVADDATDSEAWFVLGEQLRRACDRLGSATHCLREWAEPSDEAADVDDGSHRGRRNLRLWDT